MSLITQFAQPGLYYAQGMAGMRENRLAMAAQEAERATEEAQQRLRQQAFASLQGGNDPQRAIIELGAAGDIQGANLLRGIASDNASRRTAKQREEETRLNDRNEILQAMASRDDLDNPDVIEGFNHRLQPYGESVDTVRPLLPAFQNPREYELIEPGSPNYPPGGQGAYLHNRRSGQITAVAGTRPSELAGALAGIGQAIAAGQTLESPSARDRAVEAISAARESVSTTLRTAQTIAQGNPGAFGQRGNIARDTGAVVEQVFGSGAANAAARFVSGGAGLDELSRIRAATQIQVAQSIPDFTGEESGRITEAERLITEQAVGATNALSSQSGALEALAYVYPLQLSRVNRQSLLARGRLEYQFIKPNGEIDLDVLDQHLGVPMRQAGFSDEQIQGAARDVIAITRQQAAMAATGAFANE